MASWARPGVRCICIADPVRIVNDQGFRPFRRGEVLSIASSRITEFGLVLYFREREPNHWGHVDGFRPLVTRSQEQDMGLFRHHLTDAPVDLEGADA